MEIKVVLNTLGQLSVLLGVLMLVPGIVAAVYKEPLGVTAFAFSSIAAIIIGIVIKHFGTNGDMGHREAFATVLLGWLLAAVLGALPYVSLD
jgi:trk system potassium uptake protein TrkH